MPLSYSAEPDADDEDAAPLWAMFVAPLVTGDIGYAIEGAVVSLPEVGTDVMVEYEIDNREASPFTWSVGVSDVSEDDVEVLVEVDLSEAIWLYPSLSGPIWACLGLYGSIRA